MRKQATTGAIAFQELFGEKMAVYHKILEMLNLDALNTSYEFLDLDRFEQVFVESPSEGMRVYWAEMLSRAHWAAKCAIMRHQCWNDACLLLFCPEPNFLGFAAALRGMLEASADSFYSLRPVPTILTDNREGIECALQGMASAALTSSDLEDLLIHFQFARKLPKDDLSPKCHSKETVTKYIESMGPPSFLVKRLYADLCELAHPSLYSLLWFMDIAGSSVHMRKPDDRQKILDLTSLHSNAITSLYGSCISTSIMVFKALNQFSIEPLHVQCVDRMEVPGWKKAQMIYQGNMPG